MVNILDLARPETSEDEFGHVHSAEHMTGWDHFFLAFGIAAGVILWPVIGLAISTLFHLKGLAALVTIVAWPTPLILMIFIATEVMAPLGRFLQRNAKRIEGYND